MAYGRSSRLVEVWFALQVAGLSLVVLALVAGHLGVRGKQDPGGHLFTEGLTAAALLTAWGLMVLNAISPTQVAGQLVPFVAGWCLFAHPWVQAAIHAFLGAMEGATEQRRGTLTGLLWLLALGLLAVNIALKQGHFPSMRLGGGSVQPFVFALYAALAANALRLATHRTLGRQGWWCNALLAGGFVGLGELGTLALYGLTLGALVGVMEGVRNPDFRTWSLNVLGAIGALAALLLVPPVHSWVQKAQARVAHVRERVDFLRGNRQANGELQRVEMALLRPGLLGMGGGARSWLIGRYSPTVGHTAAKDYVYAALLVHTGWLGLLNVGLLYIGLFGALLRLCLLSPADPVARSVALAFVLAAAIQTVVPVAAHTRAFIAVGVPLLGLARGGSSLLCFLGGLAVLEALRQRGIQHAQKTPKRDQARTA